MTKMTSTMLKALTAALLTRGLMAATATVALAEDKMADDERRYDGR